jgi:hypothetical protein
MGNFLVRAMPEFHYSRGVTDYIDVQPFKCFQKIDMSETKTNGQSKEAI